MRFTPICSTAIFIATPTAGSPAAWSLGGVTRGVMGGLREAMKGLLTWGGGAGSSVSEEVVVLAGAGRVLGKQVRDRRSDW
ncbi:hypothetical protein GCM10027589_16110 [Actinocorallia lasiicapitis]